MPRVHISYIYTTLQKYKSFVPLSKIDFDKEEDVGITGNSREDGISRGTTTKVGSGRTSPSGVATWSPCRMIGRNPFYPQDRTKSRCWERRLVYLPALPLSPPVVVLLFIFEFVATGRKSRQHRRERRVRPNRDFPSPLVPRPSRKVAHKYLMRVMESRLRSRDSEWTEEEAGFCFLAP